MRVDDAMQFLAAWMRRGADRNYAKYGYEIFVPNAIYEYVRSQKLDPAHGEGAQLVARVGPAFLEAAWLLCMQGILRPGIRRPGEQVTDEGSGGGGFTITTYGRTWLSEGAATIRTPTGPERLAEMLDSYTTVFGPGFRSRSQEAVRCYAAHAYLATCAMCGAATESILLAVAIAQTGDEARVLGIYRAAQGRSRLQRQVIQGQSTAVQRSFPRLTELIDYWRDETAHGTASDLGEAEAFIALMMLLRFCAFVQEHWQDMTGQRSV